MIVAVIVLGVLVLALFALVLRGQLIPKQDTSSALLIKEDLTKLSDDITKAEGWLTATAERSAGQ